MASIDHVVVLVRDLDSAAVAAEELGFTLTAEGRHAHWGTSNHLAIFEGSYLELLSVTEPRIENAAWHQRSVEHPGIFALALATTNAAEERSRLEALGLNPPPPAEFGRPVRIGAATAEARFRVLMLGLDPQEDLVFFYCEHLTPELVWRGEWQQHANGAQRLTGVTVAASNISRCAARYTRLLGASLEWVSADHARIVLEQQAILLLRPAGVRRLLGTEGADLLDPQAAAVSLTVRDLAATRRYLATRSASISVRDEPGRLLVSHSLLPGVTFEIVGS